jgi:cell division protein FtsB
MKTGQQISDELSAIANLRRRADNLEHEVNSLRRDARERERLLDQSRLELPVHSTDRR